MKNLLTGDKQPLLKQFNSYCLGPQQLSKRFSVLKNTAVNSEEQEVREPSPLFVEGLMKISPLCRKLNEISEDQFICNVFDAERININN